MTSELYQPYQGEGPELGDYVSGGPDYGEMPYEALMAKFDFTNDGDTEYLYEQDARHTLKDRRPDAPTMSHEEARKTTHNAGHLNVRYYGGRGTLNAPAHPEINLSLMDKEPRRNFDGPDMRELRLQGDARMRFINFGSGNDDRAITGGFWREDQVRNDKKKLDQWAKIRMKIFSTSRDNRRESMRRSYVHASNVNKVDMGVHRYGDYIKDQALNPQRKTTVLSNENLRRSHWYNLHTSDHRFNVAQYGENRNRKLTRSTRRLTDERHCRVDDDEVCADDERPILYKTLNILQAELVNAMHHVTRDQDFHISNDAQIRKLSDIKHDIETILFKINQDADAYESTESMTRRPGRDTKSAGMNMDILEDASRDSDVANAALMYKSVTEGEDYVKQRFEANPDADSSDGQRTQDRQTAKQVRKKSNQYGNSQMEVNGTTLSAKSYKSAKAQIANQMKTAATHAFGTESRDEQIKKSASGVEQRQNRVTAASSMRKMGDNYLATRFGGSGKKYTNMNINKYGDSASVNFDNSMRA